MGRRPAEVVRGYTLLELVVVLAVLAVAVAVVTPAIGRGTEGLRTRAEVASFAATLRHAREQAITTQRAYRVTVDGEAHRVTVVTIPSPPPPGAPPPAIKVPGKSSVDPPGSTTTQRDVEVSETRALSPQLSVDPAKATDVVFDVRGGASGGDFKLTSAGITYHVTVDRLTGRVRSVRE
jgi:type II secretion system protein H